MVNQGNNDDNKSPSIFGVDFFVRPIEGGKGSFYAIDILRGIAAIGILLFHYKNFFVGSIDIPMARMSENFFVQLLWPVHKYGANAVMLFWVISGFVFMHVYAGQQKTSSKSYAINRFARLYPLHLATLLLVTLLQFISFETLDTSQIYQNNDLKHFGLQLLFASNWGFESGHSFNGPIWSVSIEMLIYVVFFVYFKTARICLLSLCAVIIAFLLLFAISDSMIALCGYYFFVGSLAYALWKVTLGFSQKSVFILGTAVFFAGIGTMILVNALTIPAPLSLQLSFVFSALIFALAAGEKAFGNTTIKPLRWIGDITYSSYLLHSPIQIAFLLLAGNGLVDGSIILSPFFYAAYFGFVCITSWLTFKYFERPAQTFIRSKLSTRNSVNPATA